MLSTRDYPQYKGKHGVLVEEIIGGVPFSGHRWRVFICGRIHPFAVCDYAFMEIK
jgi:hypothetical protein